MKNRIIRQNESGLTARFLFTLLITTIYISSPLQAQEFRYFRIGVECGHGAWQDTSFIVAASDSALIQEALLELQKPDSLRRLIDGMLDYGTGGFNRNGDHWFNWHILPDQWSFGDFAIEVCDGCPFSDLDQNTSYWVENVGAYCGWSTTIQEEVQGPITPIKDPLPELPVTLFPNPASNSFWIQEKQDVTGPIQLIIFNVLGQQVIPLQRVLISEPVSIGRLPEGTYLIRLEQEGRIKVSRLVVKR